MSELPGLGEIEILPPGRRYLAGVLTLMVIAAVATGTVVPQAHWIRTLDFLAAITVGFATIGQFDGNRWTLRARWSILGAAVFAAGAFGVLVRMVAHGIALSGR